MISERINKVRLLVYTSFFLLVTALFSFQIVLSKYYKTLSIRNSIRLIPIEASRGTIYDRNKRPLAIERFSFNLVVIPQEVMDIQKTLAVLSTISGISKERLFSNYKRNYNLPFSPVKIADDIEREKAFDMEERLCYVPGALIWQEPRRHYPDKETGAHVIGYIGRIEQEEFELLKDYGYTIRDLVGKSGIEKYYDAYLKGERGGIQVEVDAYSHQTRRLGFKEPVKGKDIVLTIDAGLQGFVDELLNEETGACIIMNSKTGEVLALASSPSFDPNLFTCSSDDRAILSLLNNGNHPLLNRAISCAYPPGSTFKIIVAVCGLATGTVNMNSSFLCKGVFNLGKRQFRCWKEEGHGSQNIIDGLTHSCNVYFYNLGKRIGAEALYRYAVDFGLGATTGIDLPQETKGLVPSPLWKRFFLNEAWYEGDTINYCIGQGYLLTTPIQILKAVTIIANEGYCPVPYIVQEIEKKKVSHKQYYNVKLKSDVFKTVKKGMFGVVNDITGTGQNAKPKDLKIAGKTGTAQPGTAGDTHAWFAGFMPYNNPQISFVIFLEHGGQGGIKPAHIARLIAIYLEENNLLK